MTILSRLLTTNKLCPLSHQPVDSGRKVASLELTLSSGSKMAPFDQDFYMMFNVAVGGTSGMFPDQNLYGGVTKPWHNSSPWSQAMADFWKAHTAWLPTWQGDNSALIIDYVEFRN
ncbi:Beta-1,3-glucan-binding protein [Bulinus truncatus]|nr:Beta-1,3-glucan-binding protein [Bulinus truncatus]